MERTELTACMEKLHFTKLEAQIYLVLLEEGEMSGYQLAKRIEISRPSIYNTLVHMYEKGMVLRVPDSTASYIAANPKVLISRLKGEYNEAAGRLYAGLEGFVTPRREEKFANLKGYEAVIYQAGDIMSRASREVYINMDFEPSCFQEEFSQLRTRGVRVVLFSFYKITCTEPGIEVYSHGRMLSPDHKPSRLMAAADGCESVIGDYTEERGYWLGSVTNHPLMTSVITEHIHNDIYLLKLKEQYGTGMFDENIRIHTEFESGRRRFNF